jgi:site-specific recombinase XerD
MEAYRLHMQLLSHKECEAEYKPMFISAAGKAMTYNTYAKRVKRLVYDYLKPELSLSEDPALSAFAHLLDSYSWAPHTLRHCFSVQLVLECLDVAQIQFYRGDRSPESALTYFANKGELMEQIKNVHQKALETLGRHNITETQNRS